ncbi:MAG: AAA family ATPase [Patescibacteria group bacterium]|nr:AAA family ATPase [Patescibacteria group bacterium]
MSYTRISSVADVARFSEVVPEREFGLHTQPLFDFMCGRVIGQERAVRRVCRHATRFISGLNRPDAPLGVLVCVGPTGWGKTLTAQEAARALIADVPEAPLTLIDCSEYTERHTISALIGTTAGYIGYGQRPLLSQEAIDDPHFQAIIKRDPSVVAVLEEARRESIARKKKIARGDAPPDTSCDPYDQMMDDMRLVHSPYYSVIVFDEWEKACLEVQRLMLGIIGNGELRMGNGSITRFRRSLIFLTSNIAGEDLQRAMRGITGSLGFQASREGQEMLDDGEKMERAMYDIASRSLKKLLPPEMVGRFGQDVVAFRPLSRAQCQPAVHKMLNAVGDALVERNFPRHDQICPPGCPSFEKAINPTKSGGQAVRLFVTPAFESLLLDEGYSSEYGLRHLRQKVEWLVMNRLAIALESGDLVDGDSALFDSREGQVVLCRRPRKETDSISNGEDVGSEPITLRPEPKDETPSLDEIDRAWEADWPPKK